MKSETKSPTAVARAHRSWARTTNRTARTAPARAAADERFYVQARELLGPDASERQVEQSAASLRSAWFVDLARKSAQARKRAA